MEVLKAYVTSGMVLGQKLLQVSLIKIVVREEEFVLILLMEVNWVMTIRLHVSIKAHVDQILIYL